VDDDRKLPRAVLRGDKLYVGDDKEPYTPSESLVLDGRGVAFKLGAFPALLGVYLLWADFLSQNREQV
jgi:hypothetical protein